MADSAELQQLRSLLLAPEVSALESVMRELEDLQREITDPGQLADRLRPAFTRILRESDPGLRLALVEAITPILDRAIRERSRVDEEAMTRALAATSTGAIAARYAEAPGTAARDLAPLMSAAIREQIRGEREAMIDALYPVIGSTISKYLSVTLQELVLRINERIESHLSFAGLWRRLRARMSGVSEAELLLRESVPVWIEAVFLIQKSSGLVIGQAHHAGSSTPDPALLSGMLTAIRSLFNESLTAGDGSGELDQIAYGESTIVLEAAGHCYLAAVVRGTLDESIRRRMQETLAGIVQLPGNPTAGYSGDPSSVPDEIGAILQALVDGSLEHGSGGTAAGPRRGRPTALIVATAVLFLAVCIPLGLWMFHRSADSDAAERSRAALSASGVTAYGDLAVETAGGALTLSGRTANELLRSRAVHIVQEVSPGYAVENRIFIPPPPPFTVLERTPVDAAITALNTVDGVFLEATLQDGRLSVDGLVPDTSFTARISRALESLPGLRALDIRAHTGGKLLGRRILFERNSAFLRHPQRPAIEAVAAILRGAPWSSVRVIGQSDVTGSEEARERIAIDRAGSVRAALLAAGIARERIAVEARPDPPGALPGQASDSLSRCALFLLMPSPAGARP